MSGLIVALTIAVVVIIILAKTAVVVPQQSAFVVEYLGKYNRTLQAGFHILVPFVERNYNLVELGPRGTGKSHLFQQVSPYADLISGGKAKAWVTSD